MKKNKNEEALLTALSRFGYPLLESEMKMDANQLLAKLVESREPRFLEGVPVVLANLLSREDSTFDLAKAADLAETPSSRRLLRYLYRVSCHLFDLYNLDFGRLNRSDMKPDEQLKNDLANDRLLEYEGTRLDSKRLKKTFLNYVLNREVFQKTDSERKEKLKEDFREEYYLSLLFFPRQKELVYKKMRGESFTKTEREYFSRVVKKKLQALADPDIHRLAQKALR